MKRSLCGSAGGTTGLSLSLDENVEPNRLQSSQFKKTQMAKVYVDSRFRDPSAFPSATSFSLPIPRHRLRNVTSVRLLNAVVRLSGPSSGRAEVSICWSQFSNGGSMVRAGGVGRIDDMVSAFELHDGSPTTVFQEQSHLVHRGIGVYVPDSPDNIPLMISLSNVAQGTSLLWWSCTLVFGSSSSSSSSPRPCIAKSESTGGRSVACLLDSGLMEDGDQTGTKRLRFSRTLQRVSSLTMRSLCFPVSQTVEDSGFLFVALHGRAGAEALNHVTLAHNAYSGMSVLATIPVTPDTGKGSAVCLPCNGCDVPWSVDIPGMIPLDSVEIGLWIYDPVQDKLVPLPVAEDTSVWSGLLVLRGARL